MNRYKWNIVTPIKKMCICTPENSHGFTMGENRCDIRLLIPDTVSVCDNKLTCGEGMLICSPDGMTKEALIQPKRTLKVVSDDESVEYLRITMDKITDGADAWDRMLVLTDGMFSFGTKSGCSVTFPACGDTVGIEYTIIKDGSKLVLRSDDVLFGVFVNQHKVKSGQTLELKDGDFIFSGSSSVYFSKGCLYTTVQTVVNGIEYRDSSEENSHLDYPHMQRTARTHIDLPKDGIEVLDPPAIPETRKQNIFTSILPSLVSVLLIIVVRGSGMNDMSMILFSVASMALGIVTSIVTYFTEQKNGKEKLIKREKTYRAYIEETTEKIKVKRGLEREKMNGIYIDQQMELREVKDFSASLFDRVQSDSDFLDIRLGKGSVSSSEQIKHKQHESFAAMDALFYEPVRLADEYEKIDGMPIVLHAREANAIGFLGSMNAQKQMMNLVTLDIVTRQYMDDVQLYYITTNEMMAEMQSIRMLPHVQDKLDGARNIAVDSDGYDELLEKLCRILSERESGSAKMANAPWLIINISSNEDILKHPIMSYIPSAAKLHALFLFWATMRENIPMGCTNEVRLFTNGCKGMLRCLENEKEDLIFEYEPVTNEEMETASNRLAPVFTGEIGLGMNLRSSCSFYEALGITEANKDNILRAWQNSDARKSLSVPIGVVEGDEVISLDLHERAHGPHGLVAGTTGSGKSEVIISYLLSLMYHFSPDEINIVIIDFKGGGMGRQLQGLPHLTGMITNLEKHEIDRSLSSIKAELERRQRILASAEVSNISDYYGARKNNPNLVPLPHLMLVVDEFAELKQQQPEFMNELISAARIGRSLGVHLILSTQKPSGVVNEQISGNMDFTMCLRVQTKADSTEVLQSPLAAEIREPGRAYLKVGRQGLFRLFQSGYSGAGTDISKEPEVRLNKVSLTGNREPLYCSPEKEKNTGSGDKKQFDAVKEAVIEAFNESGKSIPMPICLPTLERQIDYPDIAADSMYQIPFALADDPANQAQYPLVLDIAEGNTAVVGGPQSGKTTLLQTILLAAAEKLTSKQLNVYVMDFNSGIFKTMERLSVVGGVLQLDDEEGIKNLMRMMRTEVAQRKERMLEAEVISFAKYIDAGYSDLPAISLVIDNFAVFKEVYEEKYGNDLQFVLREGPAVGIATIVTCSQAMVLGYRRMCYFSKRIALYSSDSSEYSSVLEGGRTMNLPEIPGRLLMKRDKVVLMAQAYMHWASLSEQERAARIRGFIAENSTETKAKAIPGIPMILTTTLMSEMFPETAKAPSFGYAMDFATVEPITMDLYKQFEYSLISAGSENALHFVNALAEAAGRLPGGMHLSIVDGFDRVLSAAKPCQTYSVDPSDAPQMVMDVCAIAKERLRLVKEDGREAIANEPLEILVLNSSEAINAFSGNSTAWEEFSKTEERMSAMRVLFVFTDIANRQVSYSSPELLKHVRDNKKAAIFENATKIKFFDLNMTDVRANSQPLGKSDAITFGDQGTMRVRMVR